MTPRYMFEERERERERERGEIKRRNAKDKEKERFIEDEIYEAKKNNFSVMFFLFPSF